MRLLSTNNASRWILSITIIIKYQPYSYHASLSYCVCSLHWAFSVCGFPLNSTDSTATVGVIRKSFSRMTQDVYALPIEISDNGVPPLSSTNTLLIRVCSCDAKQTILSCNVEPLLLPAGLSTGALIAILACIVILLGNARKIHHSLLLFHNDSILINLFVWTCNVIKYYKLNIGPEQN